MLGRIVCQVINEAAFALGEGVGSAADIDTGMVHGLNYPRGPLAWADEIGLDHVLALLDGARTTSGARSATAPRPHCGRCRGPAGSGRQTGEGFFQLRIAPRDERRPTMRAVTFQAPGEVRVEDRPEPELPARDDAIVRIEASGICGSDLHIYHGRVKIEPGFTIGHEFVGTVIAAGDDVTRAAVGDRVLGCYHSACGTCFFCLRGLYHKCDHMRTFGHGGCARLAPGHPGRPGAGAERQPHAAQGARGRDRRRRAVRR